MAFSHESPTPPSSTHSDHSPAEPLAPDAQVWSRVDPNLINTVAHELRTPLSVILGYANILQQGHLGPLTSNQQNALDTIVASSHSLWAHVENVNAFLQASMHQSLPRLVHLHHLLARPLARQQARAAERGLTLYTTAPALLPPIQADPFLIEQAVICLVDNALKFTPEGGQIVIQLFHERAWVCCRVTDTGIGIASDDVAHVFQPFYQGDTSCSRRYGGLGLGLSIVKAVADDCQGQIEVEHTSEHGSQFLLRLPEYPAPAHAQGIHT